MTMPLYTDRYYVEAELVNDELKVTNIVLLSRALEGEPAIETDEADTAGFVASVDLDNEDKVAVEKLIGEFSQLQLIKDTTSDKFGEVVDLSMSSASLGSLKEHMTSMSGVKKVVWLLNYMEGTSNFASVKCKELFQNERNEIVEASIIYQFIKKGSKWYIYGYDITNQTKLDTTNLATTGNLCIVDQKEVVSYTSQVTNTNSAVDLDNLTDVSKVYTYEPYKPVYKKGISEQGKNKMTADKFTDKDIKGVMTTLIELDDNLSNYEDVVSNFKNTMDSYLTDESGSRLFFDCLAIYYNVSNNLYLDDREKREAIQEFSLLYDGAAQLWYTTATTEAQQEAVKDLVELINSLRRRF